MNQRITPEYIASHGRYAGMEYKNCGKSGLKLPQLSLGLWHNFGFVDSIENQRAILRKAFDLGITHFDLANNYGPPYGSAEENLGTILHKDFLPYRDELIISTKAGYDMWPGPYGIGGSRKYLFASLHQSLKRMKLDYVDVFYSHRYDPETPLEETMGALASMVKQGKALYVGISNYPAEETQEAIALLKDLGVPCLIHQSKYSMLERSKVEDGLLDVLGDEGVGLIVFSPLAQGLLTNKYLHGIPADSRANKDKSYLDANALTPALLHQLVLLNELAEERGQSLAQMALSWVLRDKRVTSVLVGASKPSQLEDNVCIVGHEAFSETQLQRIEDILAQ